MLGKSGVILGKSGVKHTKALALVEWLLGYPKLNSRVDALASLRSDPIVRVRVAKSYLEFG